LVCVVAEQGLLAGEEVVVAAVEGGIALSFCLCCPQDSHQQKLHCGFEDRKDLPPASKSSSDGNRSAMMGVVVQLQQGMVLKLPQVVLFAQILWKSMRPGASANQTAFADLGVSAVFSDPLSNELTYPFTKLNWRNLQGPSILVHI